MLVYKVFVFLSSEHSATAREISEKLKVGIRRVRGAISCLIRDGFVNKKRKGNVYHYSLKEGAHLKGVKKREDVKNKTFYDMINRSIAMCDSGFIRRANNIALESIKFAQTEMEISQAMTLASKFAKASKSNFPAFYAVAGKCNLDVIRGFDL